MKKVQTETLRLGRSRKLIAAYLIIRISVLGTLIRAAMIGEWNNVFLCFLTLFLLLIPSILERELHVNIPDALEIIILIFIFAAEILGEVREFYLRFPHWDTILHTTNGFLAAAIGLSLIDILNKHPKFAVKMSPLYVCMTAFCFSMTIGVLWEFCEFGLDMLFLTDCQKDTYITAISSVALNPDGHNVPAVIGVESVVINGEIVLPAYLDIGLIDTMKDLMVNFVGAAAFSAIGYFFIKSGKPGAVIENLLITDTETRQSEEEELALK